MKKLPLYLLFVAASGLLLSSCDPGRHYEENKLIEGDRWYYKNLLPFDVQIKDTSRSYDVYVNLRVNSDYKYSNIFLWLHTIQPEKKSDKRRIEIKLADEKGKWLGQGLGDIYDYQFPVLQNVHFPQSGFYRFEIEQNMRDDTLANVKSAGIRIQEHVKD